MKTVGLLWLERDLLANEDSRFAAREGMKTPDLLWLKSDLFLISKFYKFQVDHMSSKVDRKLQKLH